MVFDSIYLVALSAWLGSVLFLSFVVAPTVFQSLGADSAGRFLRLLFPRYYLWGAMSGALALPCGVGVPLAYPEYRGPWVGILALVNIAGILIMLYCGNALTPAINRARDEGPAGKDRFDRLHRRSVYLNGVVLLLGIGLLVGLVLRPNPRTAGILEPTPVERTRLEMGQMKNAGAKSEGVDSPRQTLREP